MKDKFIYIFIQSLSSAIRLFIHLFHLSRSDAVGCMRYILNYLIKTGICLRLCDSLVSFRLTMFIELDDALSGDNVEAEGNGEEEEKSSAENHVRVELATD